MTPSTAAIDISKHLAHIVAEWSGVTCVPYNCIVQFQDRGKAAKTGGPMAGPKKVELSETQAPQDDSQNPGIPATPAPQPASDPSNYTHARQRLSAEKLASMSAGEIRAVAEDRGYRIGLGGRRVLAARFLAFQSNDTSGDLHAPGALDVSEPLPLVEETPEPPPAS